MHIDSYICVLHNKMNHGSWNWDRKTVMQGTMLFGHLAATLKCEFLSTGRDIEYDASTYECPYLWTCPDKETNARKRQAVGTKISASSSGKSTFEVGSSSCAGETQSTYDVGRSILHQVQLS
ncbi:hypothetical protein ACOSQ3_027479 [Xanthoceras sorbifolium]